MVVGLAVLWLVLKRWIISKLKTGPYKGTKVTVDGPEYETAGSLGSA